MITIGQLAAYAGCTVKAVRVYHARGLLAEPERDAAGYRRYDAQAVIDLTRITTLAKAGVPLAEIPAMLAADDETHSATVARIEQELAARVEELQERRANLTKLRIPERLCLPDSVVAHLESLRRLGLSERSIAVERDSWILAIAVLPSVVDDLPLEGALLRDADYVAVLRGFDAAIDWAPDDPRLDRIVDAAVGLATRMSTPGQLERWAGVRRDMLEVVSSYQGRGSPAWSTVIERVNRRLAEGPEALIGTRTEWQ